jgi:NADH-quinone oxidoreductase subunit I
LLGEGILKGLGETARNFAGSFVSAERLTTVQYPEERVAPIEATRDFPFLVYDGDDWEKGLRCVDIDISVCMSCQICVEVCPFEAIKMDTEFELSTTDRFGGLLYDRKELAKSNEYYHTIHPTEAAEVDARLAEEKVKADAKAKAAAAAAAAKAAAPAAIAATPKQAATVVPAASAPAASTPAAKAPDGDKPEGDKQG